MAEGDISEPIHRRTQRVDDPSEEALAYRCSGGLACPLYRRSLRDALIAAEKHAADGVPADILDHASYAVREEKDLSEGRVRKACDCRDAVTDRDDLADLLIDPLPEEAENEETIEETD